MKSVLISGNGIAGPTLAYWLAEEGFRPTIIERAPRLRSGGYIIDFWGSGYDVAERMGLLPELLRQGYDIQEVRLVDTHGRRVGGFRADVFRELTLGRYISVARGDLAQLIYRSVENHCESIFGDSVTAIEQDAEGVRVAFEGMPERRFDIVIGADGLHSPVRRLAFGAEGRFEKYLGYCVGAFEVEGYRPRDELVYVSYAVPGKQLARFSMRGDRTLFLFVFASEQPPTIDAHATQIPKRVLWSQFANAGWECPQILSALETCDEIYFDRVSQIRMDRWSAGRVALLGDAAFCPSLLAGQGSALAMTAAYVLAGELGRARDNPELAFRRYEQVLRAPIFAKQVAAEKFAAGFVPRSALGLFIRNQITRAFSIPLVAKLAMGPSLIDRIALPDEQPS